MLVSLSYVSFFNIGCLLSMLVFRMAKFVRQSFPNLASLKKFFPALSSNDYLVGLHSIVATHPSFSSSETCSSLAGSSECFVWVLRWSGLAEKRLWVPDATRHDPSDAQVTMWKDVHKMMPEMPVIVTPWDEPTEEGCNKTTPNFNLHAK